MNEHLWWYVARSGGLVSWWLSSLAVLWGLSLSTRLIRGRGIPAWLLASHRHLGALTLVFTAVHVGGLVADDYVDFGIAEVLFPFASTWRPGAVAWGVVSLHLLVAIEITSLLMKRIRRRLWRAVHLASFAVFAMGSAHAFTAGTDRGNVAVQWTGLIVGTLFVFLVVFRQLSVRSASSNNAPSRRTTTRSPVQSTTVDGAPAQGPPSTTTETAVPSSRATSSAVAGVG